MEGDWSGDQEFDSGDLVLAMETGRYEADQPVAVVPEPSSMVLLFVGLISVIRRPPALNLDRLSLG